LKHLGINEILTVQMFIILQQHMLTLILCAIYWACSYPVL